jgi:type IV secretory pathway VirB2 component (pilin)
VPSRVRANPIATLLAVVSAVMILVSRLNRHQSWGDALFVAGIVVLVVAAALFLLRRRS